MLSYSFNGTTVLLGLAMLGLAVVATAWCLRYFRQRTGEKSIRSGNVLIRYQSITQGVAMSVALAAAYLTINWTSPAPPDPLFEGVFVEEEEMELQQVPATYFKPPPPPPPPVPPRIETVPDLTFVEPEPFTLEDETIEPVINTSLPVTTPIDFAPATSPTPPPPVTPPPPPTDEPAPIVDFVEQMPTFGEDCFALTGDERRVCSDKALMKFLYGELRYPAFARENGIEGTVVVRFVVERDGAISAVEAVRKVGGGCSEEAVAALQAINKQGRRFQPGRQNGRTVRVRYTVPVAFKLQ